jgi:hypothetical protein
MFATLSLLRLMTVALPAMIGPPLFLTHGFYQIVLGLFVVVAATRWRLGGAPRDVIVRRGAVAAAAAVSVAVTLAQPYAWAIDAIRQSLTGIAPHMLSPVASASDVQGAVAIMPGYQLGLLVGLFFALFEPRRWQLLLLLVSIAAALQVLTLVAVGEAAAHVVADLPPVALRALAVGGPLLLAALAVALDRRRRRG